MPHNLYPFKPITYNLSSEKTGFKVCLSNFNLQRYIEGRHRPDAGVTQARLRAYADRIYLGGGCTRYIQ
jgi:hypothetical protein